MGPAAPQTASTFIREMLQAGQIDPVAYHALRYLMVFCWELSGHEETTKMGVSNLALVIAPNVLKDESGDPVIFARNAEAEKGFIALLIKGVGEQHW